MEENVTRLYFPGVFDLITHKHFTILQYYRNKVPNGFLLVGVFSDHDALQVAGNVILSASEREESVKACKWVDKVVCPCPRYFTVDYLQAHRISFVCVSGRLFKPEEAVHLELDYKSQYSELRATLVMAGRFIAKKSALLAKKRSQRSRDSEQRAKVQTLESALQSVPDDSPQRSPAATLSPLTAVQRAAQRLTRSVKKTVCATIAKANSLIG